jgi:selenium metabolism protein YedF
VSSKVLLIQGETLGHGDEKLGQIIMSNFLRQLYESPDKPASMIFWNTGVKLVCEGSWALVYLKKLEEQGIEILACSTCLEYFALKDKLVVGKPTNMVQTIDSLLHKDTVCL